MNNSMAIFIMSLLTISINAQDILQKKTKTPSKQKNNTKTTTLFTAPAPSSPHRIRQYTTETHNGKNLPSTTLYFIKKPVPGSH